MRRLVGVVASGVLALAACTTGSGDDQADRPPPVPSAAAASDTYAQPWARRPVVRLSFEVGRDRRVVRGRERIAFSPDRRVCSLVFRAWPNKPQTARKGNSLRLDTASVDGRRVVPRVSADGAPAGSPGSLIELPLRRCTASGTTVRADLRFTLRLGVGTHERVGWARRDRTAWFGTAFPLLAWERGHGWMRDPAVDQFGEMAGSEEFRLALLSVVAPRGDDVLGSGRSLGNRPAGTGRTEHRFEATAVRDVAVSVGDFDVLERNVAGTRLHVGVPAAGSQASVKVWADVEEESMRALAAALGPFPYRDLWVSVLADCPTGIEFPGAIQYTDVDPSAVPYNLVPHETAHMWFYGLVGDDQGRNPWLDEGFATFAEGYVTGDPGRIAGAPVRPRVVGRLDRPMTFWAHHSTLDYSHGVYRQGAKALGQGYRRSGATAFDRALRGYIVQEAHRIARPADLRRAFAGVPKAAAAIDAAGGFG